jgi:uncharacterized membrane protein
MTSMQQVKHESKHLITIFFVGLAAGVAYFIFKIYRMYDASQEAKYLFVKEFLTFFGMVFGSDVTSINLTKNFFLIAGVTLFLLLLTIINAGICWYNFDKGLKAHCK